MVELAPGLLIVCISVSDFRKFASHWELSVAAINALEQDSYTSKAALLSLTGEYIDNYEDLEKGDRAAIRTVVTHQQMELGDGPLVNKSLPLRAAPAGFLHKLFDMRSAGEGGVEQITHATARMDLDLQHYLKQTPTGEAKLVLTMDYVSVTVQDAGEEIQLGQGATLKLAGTAKPKLSSVSPAMWISANARIWQCWLTGETWTSAASRNT